VVSTSNLARSVETAVVGIGEEVSADLGDEDGAIGGGMKAAQARLAQYSGFGVCSSRTMEAYLASR
jgi:hypothetical protein